MPQAHSPAAYVDIEAVLDTAIRLDSWPVRFRTQSRSAAIRWRHRANAFRALLRRIEEGQFKLSSGAGTSRYDHLVFRLDEHEVIIENRTDLGELLVAGQAVEAQTDRHLADAFTAQDSPFVPPPEDDDDLGI